MEESSLSVLLPSSSTVLGFPQVSPGKDTRAPCNNMTLLSTAKCFHWIFDTCGIPVLQGIFFYNKGKQLKISNALRHLAQAHSSTPV